MFLTNLLLQIIIIFILMLVGVFLKKLAFSEIQLILI
ncbi:hypothetical protein T211_04255 [Lactococcus lactis subsp. lactis bv. diacetylactis str. LD61]|nr:hypothetical protein LLDT4_09980 [Lactococcus lactis subsp. lactis bv. diacetylactis str. TIFN4]ESK79806.1 hypothetical protein T211_04255 [Lactococcus lactis subsp. lactis bv. diacetylactis str. LD61]